MMFSDKIQIDCSREDLPNFSNICLMFPGQGRIEPESYSKYFNLPIVREIFQEADELASKKGLPPISGLIFKQINSGAERSDATTTGRVVLMKNLFQLTIGTALYRYLVQSGSVPNILTSHSFGEYAALHCASVYNFETAFEIVCIREECSPKPNELGTLVALSCDQQKLTSIAPPYEYYIANVNSSTQLVIATPLKSLKGLLHFFRRNRIASKELKTVGRPYHSKLMEAYRTKFLLGLEALKISSQALSCNFISSIDGRLYEQGYKFSQVELKEHLAEQFTSPVNFDKQILSLQKLKVFGFLELSSQNVLSNFVKKTLPETYDFSSTYFGQYLERNENSDGSSVQTFKIDDSRLLSGIVGFVSKITGYSIEEISINHRFEDDLRIDSIKKAEILFHTLEQNDLESETGLELSSLKYIGDLAEYIQKRKVKKVKKHETQLSVFELCNEIWENTYEGVSDVHSGAQNFQNVTSLNLLEKSKFIDKNIVIRLSPEHAEQVTSLVASFFEAYKNSKISIKQILIIADKDDELYKAFYSFLLSFRKEEGGFSVKTVISHNPVDELLIQQQLQDPLASELLIQDGVQKVKTLRVVEVVDNKELVIRKVLSVGGSSGILKYFLSSSRVLSESQLIFLGRSSEDSEKIRQAVEVLSKNFQSVHYIKCDVTDDEHVMSLIQKLKNHDFVPDLILDGSGTEVSLLYSEKKTEEIEDEFKSKTKGAQNLVNLMSEFQFDKSRYIQFNSIASKYGNAGQTVYGMADGYSLANQISHVVWPAVYKLGMTENLGILQKLLSMGVDLLPKEKVVPFLDECVRISCLSSGPQTVNILSTKDRLVLQLQLLDKAFLKEHLGEVTAHPKMSIDNIMDKETMPFLKDHIITGKCIAPGCYGFASMYSLARVYFNCLPGVRNFRLKSLIPLDSGPVKTSMQAESKSLNQIDLKIISKVENYEASFFHEKRLPKLKFQESLKPIYDMSMTDFYSTKYIYHGPSFQVLNRVQITDDGRCLSRAVFDDSFPLSSLGLFDRIGKIVEASFQTAGFLATWHDLISLVPTFVESIEHFEDEWTEEMLLVTSPLRKDSDPDRWITDIDVINKKGNHYLKLRNVTGMRIKTYSDFPVDHTNISNQEDQWIVM